MRVSITSQELKECDNQDNTKSMVLEIFYKIGKEKGRFLLKDYNAKTKKEHNDYIKQFKEAAIKQYESLNK